MGKENLAFGDIEIEKIVFKAIKVHKVLVSNKIYSGEKDFIGYLYDDCEVKPLHMMLPKTSA